MSDPGLASDWSRDAPRVRWSRPLGEGYSATAVVGGRVITSYSEGDEEVVIALAATTGDELWSHRYTAPRPRELRLAFGSGPHATPLVVGGRVFAVGTTGLLSALDAASGALLWRVDLWREQEGVGRVRGYGSSPLAWEETVIVPFDAEGQGVAALDQRTGQTVWQQHGFSTSQSSPILFEVDGQEWLVLFADDEALGLDPGTGEILWRHPHPSFGPYNISTPVGSEDGVLFVSSAYGGGSRALEVEAGARPRELWHEGRMSVHFTNAVRVNDHVYASTGRASVMLAAINVRSGELAWRDRSIGRANLLALGQRAVVLEGEGRLLLVELSAEGPTILAETQLTESRTWTVPALVGNVLFVRDRSRIMAVELPLAE